MYVIVLSTMCCDAFKCNGYHQCQRSANGTGAITLAVGLRDAATGLTAHMVACTGRSVMIPHSAVLPLGWLFAKLVTLGDCALGLLRDEADPA